ncbi:TonB-dependent receptor [Alteromonas sp. C1M14]|uniref:TonB-dependent receptor n=1 Tax=Alteromonas sp. C1M14 TaxID=2841567 RepID=UPI001C0A4149|nr:TonB-dependent receptor [Alteromonas sp. C1M14]MBU2978527.1 TonB-dependent receptor [Alteromonas sp. C1M14]
MKNNIFKASLCAMAVAGVLSSGIASAADNTSGTIQGTIATATANTYQNYHVEILNPATGFKKSISIGENGDYRLPKLSAGAYTVRIFEGNEVKLERTVNVAISRDTIVDLKNDIERIAVTGRKVYLDTNSAESGLNISAESLAKIPVPRDVTSVAMLAPGVTLGDTSFGDSGQTFASFGGASVAENAFYINGLNVTNFRNGLGGSGIPFEFYDSFEVKTGGYSAEFGRSTGGVVNAVTKRGTNEFHAGASAYWEPNSLRDTAPDVRYRDGSIYINNADDYQHSMETNLYASGALIKDKLFFYGIYTLRDIKSSGMLAGSQDVSEYQSDDPFWGLKVDWQINDDHSLALTAFSDETTNPTYSYDASGELKGITEESRGGDNFIVNYKGYLTDTFSVSALYGVNKYSLTTESDADVNCPLIVDVRSDATTTYPGCWVNSIAEKGDDKRKATRIDFEWQLDDHLIRFGYDREENTSFSQQNYSGGAYYLYTDALSGAELNNGGIVPDGVNQVVQIRQLTNVGSFETISSAYYLEDTWNATDDITVTAGLRNETFNNKNVNGESFIKVDDQWAPRLGIIWDVNGDGNSRLYGNFGRYYLPVANNTNVRLAGSEDDRSRFYALDAVNADGTPVYDPANEIGGELINSNGQVKDPLQIVDQTIKPMYQDEYIIGYETVVADDWSMGLRTVYRDLKTAMDDICNIDDVMVAKGYENNHTGCVLTNPGTDISISYSDADGNLVPVNVSAEELGFDEATRKYLALEYNFAKTWDGVWSLQGSYVWSHSWGNAEGYVKSDNGQDDAGLTQDFDLPELMDGAYGNLPNDRRHTVKLFGSYAINEQWLLGINYLLQSGRPINGYGVGHPDGTPAYGDTFYLDGTNFVPRGSFGRTDWVSKVDLSLEYTPEWDVADLSFRADIFNLFDQSSVTQVYETAEQSVGVEDRKFLLPTGFQTPRSVRLSASIRF